MGGEQEQRKGSFAGMTKALLIALPGIFAVLVLQFNSFTQPAVIFDAIPFAVTGMVLSLWLARYTFSFTSFIGLTSLAGIVVNNSIILVDLRELDVPCRRAMSKKKCSSEKQKGLNKIKAKQRRAHNKAEEKN